MTLFNALTPRTRFVLGLLVLLSADPSQTSFGAASPGQQKALIIAVQSHHDPRLNLNFTNRDSDALRKTLTERAGLPASHITLMNDEAPDAFRPTLENLRKELKRFLRDVKPEDRLILFFSGHGFIRDGVTYLVPSDFRRETPEKTGLPAAEFREALSQCPARVKFLILDCCQAGGEKGIDDPGIPSEVVAKGLDLQQVPGCIVLASCQAREKSYEWPEHRCSVFTYWLCRGLEGGADEDADGHLTADEVYKYSYDRVSKTVSQVLGGGRAQTPVRSIGLNVAGPQEVLTLIPESPESLCKRLAAHLDLEARLRKLKKLGVLEFLEPYGRVEGLSRSNLPAYCAERVRLELTHLAGREYGVLDAPQLQKATRGLKFSEIGDPDAMRDLAANGGGLDSVVAGTLRRRGRNLNLQCDLISTADGESLVRPGGLLPLTETLLADDGQSFDNRERPKDASPGSEAVVVKVVAESRKPSPLLDPKFPFRVDVWSVLAPAGTPVTDATPRVQKPFRQAPSGVDKADPGTLLIGASAGEAFEIRIKNGSDKQVGLVLLLDGINSLGRKVERIEEARCWRLEPGTSAAIGDWYAVDPTAAVGTVNAQTRRFVFENVSGKSLDRETFGDALGTITAAFFEAKPGSETRGPTLRVGQGDAGQRELKTKPFVKGRLLGAVTIRYVPEEAVKKIAVAVPCAPM